jgi:hypothetical protein
MACWAIQPVEGIADRDQLDAAGLGPEVLGAAAHSADVPRAGSFGLGLPDVEHPLFLVDSSHVAEVPMQTDRQLAGAACEIEQPAVAGDAGVHHWLIEQFSWIGRAIPRVRLRSAPEQVRREVGHERPGRRGIACRSVLHETTISALARQPRTSWLG